MGRLPERLPATGPPVCRLNGQTLSADWWYSSAVTYETEQAVLAAIIALSSSFGSLLIYIGFTLNIFAALTVISLFRLRRENRAHVKVCVGYPVTPLVFLAFTLWMTIWSMREEPWATLAGVATLVVGYFLYLLRARQARLVEETAGS